MYVPFPLTSGGSLQRFEGVTLGNTCSVTNRSSDWINTTVNNSTGDCTINYGSSIWLNAPTCVCSANADSKICTVKVAPSTTSAEFTDYSNGGAASAAGMFIQCFGVRAR